MRKTDLLAAGGALVAWLAFPVTSEARTYAAVLGGLLLAAGVLARFARPSGAAPGGSRDWSGSAPKPIRAGERVAAIEGDGTFAFHKVVGESRYQRALSRAAGGRTEDGVEVEVQAQLVFEPDNPHDPHAVAVYVGGDKVGYIAREYNVAFRQEVAALNLDPSLPLVCRGLIVGGWSRGGGADLGSFGIRLDIPYED
jgi:hypothetical protein